MKMSPIASLVLYWKDFQPLILSEWGFVATAPQLDLRLHTFPNTELLLKPSLVNLLLNDCALTLLALNGGLMHCQKRFSKQCKSSTADDSTAEQQDHIAASCCNDVFKDMLSWQSCFRLKRLLCLCCSNILQMDNTSKVLLLLLKKPPADFCSCLCLGWAEVSQIQFWNSRPTLIYSTVSVIEEVQSFQQMSCLHWHQKKFWNNLSFVENEPRYYFT